MAKWKKFTVHDADGVPIFKFQAKKMRKGKSLQSKSETHAIGFAPIDMQPQNICTCP